jgi:hypothetical protein
MSEPIQEVIDPPKPQPPAVVQRAPLSVGNKGVELRTLDDFMRFADWVCKAGLAPDNLVANKTPDQARAAVAIVIQTGLEVGLSHMQSLKDICVVNGRACLHSDAPKALVMCSGLVEYACEKWDEATQTATCTMRRKGLEGDISRTFSMADAAKAGLTTKKGPWMTYPRRMCENRARTFCLRDGFADCLMGIHIAEEVESYTVEPIQRKVVSASEDPLIS